MKINTKTIGNVNYNVDYANSVSEEQWLKEHEVHGATLEHFKSLQVEKPKEEKAKGK